MYRRQNTLPKQNADGQNVNQDIIEEQTFDNDFLSIGNEGVNRIFNEKNSNDILDPSAAENFSLQEFKAKILDKHPAQKQAIDFMNQLIKDGQSEGDEEKIEDDKESLIKEGASAEEEKILGQGVDEFQSQKKKNKASKKPKKSKKSQNTTDENAANPYIETQDLTQFDESLEPVEGLDLVVEKLPARKKKGGGTKFLNWLSYYTGKTIGKIGGFFATIGKGIADLFKKGPGTFRGIFNGMRGSSRFKNKENPGTIPGWDGATFEEVTGSDEQVNVDFRRVPEVWSKPTAEKAAEGDDNDKSAKPRDPVISVYARQVSDEYTASDRGTGHTFIGIDYSRYSAKSGHWQRYNVRFGYYHAGGPSGTARNAVTGYNNATIPGRVLNEENASYHISRSYQAKPKQISNVLRAAESYAERGGYNAYTRNCTTFAKEMVVDVAGIKGAESLFTQEDVTVDSKTNLKMFGAAAAAPIFKADMENGFEKMRTKEDLGYQNFGNMMTNKDEYERYKKSLKLWSKRSTKTYSPNALVENMKRAEGGRAGKIGKYTDTGYSSLSAIIEILNDHFPDLKEEMEKKTPEDQEMPEEIDKLMKELDVDYEKKMAELIPNYKDDTKVKKSKQSDLVNARTFLTDRIKILNTLLFKYYKNDKNIQKIVLGFIDNLNNAITLIDNIYQSTGNKDLDAEDKDLGNLKRSFTERGYEFDINGTKLRLSPSGYEAWIQIYKDPKIALEKAAKYQELLEKKEDDSFENDEELKEFLTLSRINELAGDFEKSHNYIMEKEKFNQQDVDYAFSLEKKEYHGGGGYLVRDA